MEFKGNKKPDTYQVFKSNSIKQCSQIWIQLQLASTFSLFFSAALEFFLGFSQQLQKCAKIQTFSTPCRTVTSLGLTFFKSLQLYAEFPLQNHSIFIHNIKYRLIKEAPKLKIFQDLEWNVRMKNSQLRWFGLLLKFSNTLLDDWNSKIVNNSSLWVKIEKKELLAPWGLFQSKFLRYSLKIETPQMANFSKWPNHEKKIKMSDSKKNSFSSSANSQYFYTKISWIGPWVGRTDWCEGHWYGSTYMAVRLSDIMHF